MSFKRVVLPTLHPLDGNFAYAPKRIQNAPPRRAATGRSLHNGALRFYGRGQQYQNDWALLPACTASSRNRNRRRNA